MPNEVIRIGCNCYLLEPLELPVRDEGFTASYSILGGNWAFFHDYRPDHYIPVRDGLLHLRAGQVFQHNTGAPGTYYDSLKKSFLVDLAIPFGQEHALNALEWLTEAEGGATLTHLTAWNRTQCTGRIALEDHFGLVGGNTRETKGRWSFSDLRDRCVQTPFLEDLFRDFRVKEGSISDQLPWYEESLLEDNFVILRLEYDNETGLEVRLHDVALDVTKSTR